MFDTDEEKKYWNVWIGFRTPTHIVFQVRRWGFYEKIYQEGGETRSQVLHDIEDFIQYGMKKNITIYK